MVIDMARRSSRGSARNTTQRQGLLPLQGTTTNHNLGSVPEFCDQTVLVKGTVLNYGPTETTFTRDNLERAFGGVLRHFVLGGTDLHDDEDSRKVTILTDDERPDRKSVV